MRMEFFRINEEFYCLSFVFELFLIVILYMFKFYLLIYLMFMFYVVCFYFKKSGYIILCCFDVE